jgi:hypothetical protein
MFNWIKNLFLVKEIKSKTGELHFQRYRIIECRLFALYLHYIAKADEDAHLHSHPWNFYSLILKGGYYEDIIRPDGYTSRITRRLLSLEYRFYDAYHKVIQLIKPTWTLVLVSPKKEGYTWGYLVDGKHVDFETYRENKNEGMYK